MGRQAGEKLPGDESLPRRGVAPSSQHGSSERPGARRGISSPNPRWAISSRERVGLYLHEQ